MSKKKVGVVVLTRKMDFNVKSITRNKEVYYILKKGSNFQEDIDNF